MSVGGEPREFYLRSRGLTVGPYDLEEIRARVAAQKITPVHEMSYDGAQWFRAGQIWDVLKVASRRPNPPKKTELLLTSADEAEPTSALAAVEPLETDPLATELSPPHDFAAEVVADAPIPQLSRPTTNAPLDAATAVPGPPSRRQAPMQTLQLHVDPPAAGAWNMGVDEMLMQRAADEGLATLRFYQWEPTLSLGYFQAVAERAAHAASRACPLVRRSSGGGAILHDRELTYSISLPTAHPLAADAETLYRNIHGTLLLALAEFGVTARLNEAAQVHLAGEPFLCFQRRAVGDVLLGADKICGSAQRRRRGAILQHGSVLLARSPHAPELPGIYDLVGSPSAAGLSAERLAEVWSKIWRQTLGPLALCEAYSPAELSLAEFHTCTKYRADDWTNRR